MTRTLAHAINNISAKYKWNFELWSVYDKPSDLIDKYVPLSKFKAFESRRIIFILKLLMHSKKADTIIISHIHLALVGLIIKLFNPECKIWLIAHGIEVWRPLTMLQGQFLKICDKIVCVSNFTKEQMIARHKVNENKCDVLNNAVDAFMQLPVKFDKPKLLMTKYRITNENPVVFTLTRLASSEQYKGHDQVIRVISKLTKTFPSIRYILAGQYDHKEEIRIQKLISAYHVDKEVILTGFLNENELIDHFLLADLFILPSKKEGFGIVFIEALACGLPVICGNTDGSLDAIDHGRLGKGVNPENINEVEDAIKEFLNTPLTATKRKYLQEECLKLFNEVNYMQKIEDLFKND